MAGVPVAFSEVLNVSDLWLLFLCIFMGGLVAVWSWTVGGSSCGLSDAARKVITTPVVASGEVEVVDLMEKQVI